jgi:hypothetical protein
MGRLDKSFFLFRRGDQGRTVTGFENFYRMGVEGHDDRFPPNGFSPFFDLVEKDQMPFVDTIEISDGKDWRAKLARHGRNIIEYFHTTLYSFGSSL